MASTQHAPAVMSWTMRPLVVMLLNAVPGVGAVVLLTNATYCLPPGDVLGLRCYSVFSGWSDHSPVYIFPIREWFVSPVFLGGLIWGLGYWALPTSLWLRWGVLAAGIVLNIAMLVVYFYFAYAEAEFGLLMTPGPSREQMLRHLAVQLSSTLMAWGFANLGAAALTTVHAGWLALRTVRG